jgi:hypothetical protein
MRFSCVRPSTPRHHIASAAKLETHHPRVGVAMGLLCEGSWCFRSRSHHPGGFRGLLPRENSTPGDHVLPLFGVQKSSPFFGPDFWTTFQP